MNLVQYLFEVRVSSYRRTTKETYMIYRLVRAFNLEEAMKKLIDNLGVDPSIQEIETDTIRCLNID